MPQWICIIAGKQSGPFTDEQVRQLIATRKLGPQDYVWNKALPNWIPAGQVYDLFPAAAGGAAPPPAYKSPPPPPPPRNPDAIPPSSPPPIAAPVANPVAYRQPSAGATFNVHVTSDFKDIGRGNYKCHLSAGGLTLTRKNKMTLNIPVGASIAYVDGSRFTAVIAPAAVNIRINMQTKYNARFTRDLVAFLRNGGPAPALSNYTLEWYLLIAVFLPLVTLPMWIGAIAWGVSFGVCGLVAFLAQREKIKTWLRALICYGTALVFVAIILIANIIAYQDAVRRTGNSGGSSGGSSSPPISVYKPIEISATPPADPALKPELPLGGQPVNLLENITGPYTLDRGVIMLKTGQRLATPVTFRPPAHFRIVAMTDSTNLRMSYAADEIIFNWEGRPDELRVDGGPAGGRHKAGAGKIPVNQYVTIDWDIKPGEMKISVDGAERYRVNADFSKINKPFLIYPQHGSTLHVKSITLTRG